MRSGARRGTPVERSGLRRPLAVEKPPEPLLRHGHTTPERLTLGEAGRDPLRVRVQISPKGLDPATQVKQSRFRALLLGAQVVASQTLPAGLLLYWLVSTVFTVIQQYLIIGWGSTFPIFGWTPAFARDHTPRFPVSIPAPKPAKDGTGAPATPTPADRSAAAASTIRRRERGRQGRRGRRR